MKNLSTIRMVDFIELLCGNLDKIKEKGEKVTLDVQRKAVSRLVMDYKKLVNPAGIKSVVFSHADNSKRRAKMQILQNCSILLAIGGVDEVVEILGNLGYNAKGASREGLEERVYSEMRRLKFEQERYDSDVGIEEEHMNPNEVRCMFDSEIASIMTFFKMNIDINTISASVYGNMVAIAHRESKSIRQQFKIK